MYPFVRRAVRRAYDGGAWHGPALADALRDLDVQAATARPIADAHTIAELVHHLTAWTREVTRRLHGAEPAMPIEGDWPDPSVPIEGDAWERLRAELISARNDLLVAVDAFPVERLEDRVGAATDTATGGAATFGQTLIGLAEHDAYHGGQIVLLRRLIDGAR